VCGFATDYYVSPSGSDGNSGSAQSPWKTLQKAADNVDPGDNVYVLDGDYRGFDIRRSGSAQNPITFKASGSNVVINDGNSVTNDCVNVEGADYIIIDGFIIRDSPRMGIRFVLCTGGIVRNNDVRDTFSDGIFSGFASNFQVLNNRVQNTASEHCIYISNSRVAVDNIVVRGNEVSGSNDTGIHVNGDCGAGGDGLLTNVIVEDNYVHDNGQKGMDFSSVRNSVIRNNIFVMNGRSGRGAAAIHFTDEVYDNCNLPSHDNVVVNNTIWEDEIAGIRFTDGADGNYVFNNVIICPNDQEIADEVGGNFIDSSSNLLQNSVSGIFVDANGRDFHLATSSPAIDGGSASYMGNVAPNVDREGDARPSGNDYDIGASESGGSPPPVDIVAPTVKVTDPPSGAFLRGMVSVVASASDNVGVVGVQFQMDGVNFGAEQTQSPYGVQFDTNTLSDGAHAITAVARDASGNIGTSSAVTVDVDNTAPNVAITSPANGWTVSETVLMVASASDQKGVAWVQFLVDGSLFGSQITQSPYEVSLNTHLLTDGSHEISAVAQDVTGNTATASVVSVTVDNGASQGPVPPQQVAASATSPGCASIAWQSNSEPDVTGYIVYYGQQSVARGDAVVYQHSRNVGNSTRLDICELETATYYLAVRAYNSRGDFSGYSAEQIVDFDGGPPSTTESRSMIVPDGYWINDPSRPLEIRELPMGWTVRIFDVAGTQVREFNNGDSDGIDWSWDFTNDHGARVARGMYLIRVIDVGGRVKHSGRFVVQGGN
jgi:parallel beta-helix repeat protein